MHHDKEPKTKFNHIFFKRSIECFGEDLEKFSSDMFSLSDEILLDLMSGLVAVKEILESLENKYLKK
jgi:hypothetical protein